MNERIKSKPEYEPDWINAQVASDWLGVSLVTLWRWRTRLRLAYTSIHGKTVMYDRKQITQILNRNSTYAIMGDVKLDIGNYKSAFD